MKNNIRSLRHDLTTQTASVLLKQVTGYRLQVTGYKPILDN